MAEKIWTRPGGSPRVAKLREGSCNHHPIEAGDNPTDLLDVSVSEGAHNAEQCTAPTQQSPGIDRELMSCLVPALPRVRMRTVSSGAKSTCPRMVC
jgi:hypothetical protein